MKYTKERFDIKVTLLAIKQLCYKGAVITASHYRALIEREFARSAQRLEEFQNWVNDEVTEMKILKNAVWKNDALNYEAALVVT